MKIIDNFIDKYLEKHLKRYLTIKEAEDHLVTINSYLSEKDYLTKNRIWYRGQTKEIEQMFCNLDFDDTAFWKQSSDIENIRKIHSGIPSLMCNTLANICIADFLNIEIDNEEYQKVWDEIEKDNQFYKQLYNILCIVLSEGDGAIKIVYNPDISEYPILQFVDSLNVNYVYQYNNRLKEVIFRTDYKKGNDCFHLLEYYGYGYIKYRLYDNNDNEINLNELEETKDLKDIEFYKNENEKDNKLILAIPIKIWDSSLFAGRGKSIFDGKDGAFDMLDEVISQWIDAIRKGRIKTYIPSSLLPKDEDGNILYKNDYVNNFIQLDTSNNLSEKFNPEVKTTEPQIQTEKYLESYCTALDLCLQGIMNSASIGIDDNKINNNSLAAREKEKITLQNRAAIVDSLSDSLKLIVINTLKSYYLLLNKNFDDTIDVQPQFGEYASPSFESKIEVLSKAAPGMIIMRPKEIIEEMYGDTKSQEEKEEIEKELKELNNMGTLDLNDLYAEDINADNNL